MKTIVEVAQNLIKPFINSEDKKYAANIAPVETSPATAAHTAGTQLIYNGVLYDVTANIAADDPLATTGAGANIALANKVTEQLSSQKQALSDEANASAITGVKNVHPYPYYRESGYQHNGYTFNYDSEGVFTINGTLESGKTSGYIQLLTKGNSADFVELLKSAAFKIISTQVSNSVCIAFDWYDANDSYISEIKYTANGDKVVVPSNAKYLATYITVNASSLTNYELAFMVAPVNVANPTYQPYAMTNRELTEKINEEFLQNAASISAQINYKDVYLFTTNGGSSSGSAQYSSAYLVFGQATTQITYFALKEGTEITPSVDGTTFTLTASTSITMAYRKL